MAWFAQEQANLLKKCEKENELLRGQLERYERGDPAITRATNASNDNVANLQDDTPLWLVDAEEHVKNTKNAENMLAKELAAGEDTPLWLLEAERKLENTNNAKNTLAKERKPAAGNARKLAQKRPVTFLNNVLLLCSNCAEQPGKTPCKPHNTASNSMTCGEFRQNHPQNRRIQL